jgi:hypothetical protein
VALHEADGVDRKVGLKLGQCRRGSNWAILWSMSLDEITIRVAGRRDAGPIADIYAPIVRETAISFEADPPTAAIMAERIEATLPRFPWLVAERARQVVATPMRASTPNGRPIAGR